MRKTEEAGNSELSFLKDEIKKYCVIFPANIIIITIKYFIYIIKAYF